MSESDASSSLHGHAQEITFVDNRPAPLSIKTKVFVESPEPTSTVFSRENTILVDQRDILPPPPTAYVPPHIEHRNLILCFDGTGDQFDADNSNIVQFFSALKRDDKTKQMVYYQSGIGTYTSTKSATPVGTKLSLMLDTAIARNLKSHVMSGYEFLMQNYTPGDRISIFGFSRGAYTARSLAGMIHKVGLLPMDNHQQVPFAYKMYTRADWTGWAQSNAFKKAFSNDVHLDFVGCFDTVDSVGFFPCRLPFTTSNTIVRTFRHAISLDERRSKFQANLWNWPNKDEKALGTPNRPLPQTPRMEMRSHQVRGYTFPLPSFHMRESEKEFDEDEEQAKFESAFVHHHLKTEHHLKRKKTDVVEVWFAGCHCDVGGGSVPNNTRNSLAKIPLRWMIRECFKAETGIIFDAQRLVELGLDPSTLYPRVLKRPAPIAVQPTDPDMRIARRPPRKTWLQRVFGKKKTTTPAVSCSMEDAELALSPDSGTRAPTHVYQGMEEEEDLKDALSPIYDQLKLSPVWWILEVLPFSFRTQNLDDTWDTTFRWNLGRARKIPHQQVPKRLPATQPDDEKTPPEPVVNLKVHRTVAQRVAAQDHKGRFYKHRAQFVVEPEWVD
ncbi:hypothetical protein C8F01DRAFT_1151097 [Mycena amicta]|nr:hypothetical protein C8F01DRAFT_1151097 [Mycena amicta]